MPKSRNIILGDATTIPILYEDRNILAIDKPPGWMLAPSHWDRTGHNLQLALEASLKAREFWAASRNLKFLRFVHRLDAETSGLLLLARSPGAITAYQKLFETRQVQKLYLAVVQGIPTSKQWTCRLALAPDPQTRGRMTVQPARKGRAGDFKPAETHFQVLATHQNTALVAARPVTGRTHQVRVHLAESGHPVLGDPLYGGERAATSGNERQRAATGGHICKQIPSNQLALRAVAIAYREPFTGKNVRILAPVTPFLTTFGFKEEHARGFFVHWPDKNATPSEKHKCTGKTGQA